MELVSAVRAVPISGHPLLPRMAEEPRPGSPAAEKVPMLLAQSGGGHVEGRSCESPPASSSDLGRPAAGSGGWKLFFRSCP